MTSPLIFTIKPDYPLISCKLFGLVTCQQYTGGTVLAKRFEHECPLAGLKKQEKNEMQLICCIGTIRGYCSTYFYSNRSSCASGCVWVVSCFLVQYFCVNGRIISVCVLCKVLYVVYTVNKIFWGLHEWPSSSLCRPAILLRGFISATCIRWPLSDL